LGEKAESEKMESSSLSKELVYQICQGITFSFTFAQYWSYKIQNHTREEELVTKSAVVWPRSPNELGKNLHICSLFSCISTYPPSSQKVKFALLVACRDKIMQ
jgi:hypothetical protein